MHFFDGSQRAIGRHIQMVNKFGFDAWAFDLHRPSLKSPRLWTSLGQWGLKHIYAEQIEILLNEILGPKILFTFSNPSAAAFEALHRRGSADVKALICDSGPSGGLWIPGLKLTAEFAKQRKFKQSLMASSFAWTWSLHFHKDLLLHVKSLPQNFRLLSIRGWKDPIISPEDIDQVFQQSPQIQWQKLSLPEATHLDGLKRFPREYHDSVKKFLDEVAEKLV